MPQPGLPRVEPAFEVSLAQEPRTNPDLPASLFVGPEYWRASGADSVELLAQAVATFVGGEVANSFSNTVGRSLGDTPRSPDRDVDPEPSL